MIVGVRAADVNDAGVRQILDEEIENTTARVLIQGIEYLVDEYPRRRVQHHAREGQGLLFIVAQFVIPTPGDIQQRLQPVQLEPNQRIHIGGGLEGLGRRWVGEDLAQRAGRKVGGARHAQEFLASRVGDSAGAPRPQPCQCAKQQSLPGSRFPDDQDSLAGLDLHFLFLEHGGAGGRGYLQIIDVDLAGFAWDEGDATLDVVQHIDVDDRTAEARDAQQGRAPIGDGAEIVHEPAQRGLHLYERARRHHQAAERDISREIQGRCDQYRSDQREPAVARGYPGEVGETGDQPAGGGQHRSEIDLDAPLFVRFTRGERNGVDVLVDAYQRKSQIGLARIALLIAVDQAAADP